THVHGTAGSAVPGDGVDQAGLRIDHADPIVQRVGDVDVAVRRNGDGTRRIERRAGCRPLVAVIAVFAGSGDGRDDARWSVDPADTIVVRVRDDQITVGCDSDAVRRVKLRVSRLTAVA